MGSYSYFPEAFTSISTGHLEFHNIFVVTLQKKRQENHMLIGAPSSTTFGINRIMLKMVFGRVIYKWATFEWFQGHEYIK